MRTNTAKAKLKSGEAIYGCFVRTPDPSLVEFLGYQGWDFMIFDGEHGTLSVRDCEDMTRAAELRGVTPLVRATVNQRCGRPSTNRISSCASSIPVCKGRTSPG